MEFRGGRRGPAGAQPDRAPGADARRGGAGRGRGADEVGRALASDFGLRDRRRPRRNASRSSETRSRRVAWPTAVEARRRRAAPGRTTSRPWPRRPSARSAVATGTSSPEAVRVLVDGLVRPRPEAQPRGRLRHRLPRASGVTSPRGPAQPGRERDAADDHDEQDRQQRRAAPGPPGRRCRGRLACRRPAGRGRRVGSGDLGAVDARTGGIVNGSDGRAGLISLGGRRPAGRVERDPAVAREVDLDPGVRVDGSGPSRRCRRARRAGSPRRAGSGSGCPGSRRAAGSPSSTRSGGSSRAWYCAKHSTWLWRRTAGRSRPCRSGRRTGCCRYLHDLLARSYGSLDFGLRLDLVQQRSRRRARSRRSGRRCTGPGCPAG